MSLAEIREILSVVTPAAVVLGVIVALVQLRDLRRLRQMEVVMGLFDRFDDDSFQRHFQRLNRWRFRDLDDFERRAKGDDWVALYSISSYFENMGLLYKRKLAPIDLLDDIMSGPLTESWRITGPIWLAYRRKYGRPMMAEWFELLAVDMEKRLAVQEGRKPRAVKLDDAGRGRPTGADGRRRPRRKGNEVPRSRRAPLHR